MTRIPGRARTGRACKAVGGFEVKGVLRNRLKVNAGQLFWQAYQPPEHTMRLIIEARIDDGQHEAKREGRTIV